MEPGYIVAFTMGFLGGFGHCISMCGPIVATYTLSGSSSYSPAGRVFPHLFYNTGRITTYMFIGALMGLTGSFINVAGRISGFQDAVAIIAGLIMVFMGLKISGILGRLSWLEGHNNLILRAGKELLHDKSLWKYYPLGALFGFLPCGLSYTVLIAAAGTGDPLSGMLLMLFFGIGTLPALLVFGMAASYIGIKLRGMLFKTAGGVVIVTGIYFVLRGIKFNA